MEFIDKNYRFYRDISQLGSFNMLSLAFVEKFSENANLHKHCIPINIKTQEILMDDFWKLGDSILNFDKKFLIVNIRLYDPDIKLGHANILLFEKKDGKIYAERYDPSYDDSSYRQNILDETVKKVVELFGAHFRKFNCTVGPQTVSLDIYGYCQTYTIEYLIKRLNTNMSSTDIKREMLRETLDLDAHYILLENRIKDIMLIILSSKYITNDMAILLLNYNILEPEQKLQVGEYLQELYRVIVEN